MWGEEGLSGGLCAAKLVLVASRSIRLERWGDTIFTARGPGPALCPRKMFRPEMLWCNLGSLRGGVSPSQMFEFNAYFEP